MVIMMGIVEILALILIFIVVIKLIVSLVKPELLFSLGKTIYSRTVVVQFIALLLAGIVGYFLTAAGIDLIEIMAVFVLAFLLLAVTIAPFEKRLVTEAKQMFDHGEFWQKNWPGFLIWLALAFWAAYQLLQKTR
jgi:hypothetical protein